MNSSDAPLHVLRIGLILVALSFSLFMWKANEPLPTENKELYRKIIVAGKQQEAILGLVSDLKAYAETHPDFRPILERHPVKKWLDSAP
jgi:hypothetical protein